MALKPLERLAWLYILDHCDAGGCYEHVPELMEFSSGILMIDPVAVFGETECVPVPGAVGRYWIPQHILFQYHKLPPNSLVSEAIWNRWHKENLFEIVSTFLPDIYLPPEGYADGRYETAAVPEKKTPAKRRKSTRSAVKRDAKYGKAAALYESIAGTFPWGFGGEVLKPYYEKHGEERTLKGLRLYLEQTDKQYISLGRFKVTGERWIEEACGTLNQNGTVY